MKKIVAIALFILTANFAFSQTLRPATSAAITFKIKNMGIGTGGKVSGLQADVKFNPSDLASSKLEATVETSTINTDNSSRDEHLHSESYFDVAKYPKMTLKSIAFKHKSGNEYLGTFNLTIKNKTRQVEIPFTFTDKGASVAFSGTFKINRLDFGVGSNSLILSNEVTVLIEAETAK